MAKIKNIVERVSQKFRTFGGGKTSYNNPVANALKNEPPMFAAGVDVQEVVKFILKEAKKK